MASADQNMSPPIDAEGAMSAGEFVLKKLFAEFVALSERKLQNIATQPLDYPLGRALQKGEDAHFDQLLNSLNEVASFCLTSILTSIFKWRDMEIQQSRSNTTWSTVPSGDVTDSPYPASKREKEYLTERQELAIEFLFCLVLIEVLTKLSVHPVPESFIHTIEDYAFKHFKMQEALKDRTNINPNVQNMKKIADLYAEVIGILSQSRFHSVKRRFFLEIRDSQNNSSTVISIIEGMSFIRVKMFPVEELEQWFLFLQECATFFLESSREKIKHAIAALLVEILYPVAAVINVEASLPVIKRFVAMLYNQCFEQARKGRHSTQTAYIPLVTVLLAISEQQFFLNYWHNFVLQILVQNIKRGDEKVQRVALESLNRLVWVYMVRIKGESNMTTQTRIRFILELLFPRGQKGIIPKDNMPINQYVKLIQFISRVRLDHAMHEVLELLSLGRSRTNINPERMQIGLRAFLLIADSREKKEGDPPMPLVQGPLPSRGPVRTKTKFLSTMLTDEIAKKIGIANFFPKVRQALDGIMRALDHSVGRSFVQTNSQVVSRPEEILGGQKPKLDLLRTCVAAIPRILPEGMSREDLLDLLSRLTIHMDNEIVRTTMISLTGIVTNFPTWRHNVTRIYALFILRDIPDNCPLTLESALKFLIQMVTHWKGLITAEASQGQQSAAGSTVTSPQHHGGVSSPPTTISEVPDEGPGSGIGGESYYCIPYIEACALVTLCSYRSVTRRLSLALLKETRLLHEALGVQSDQATVWDVIEKATPTIIRRYLQTLSYKERNELHLGRHGLNLTWMADRSSCFLEQGGSRDSLRDAWTQCLAGLLEPDLLPDMCPSSIHIAWPYAYNRMVKAYGVLDPGFVAHEKGERPPSIKGRRPVISSVEMFLWRNYLIFVSCTAPPSTSLHASLMSSGEGSLLDSSGRHELNARNLFSKVVPLIRTEAVQEIREVAITALGMVNPNAFGDLVEELGAVIHDALDQRKGDHRKRRRRETLRVQVTRVFALNAEHGCFHQSPMARTEKGEVSSVFLEFIEGIKNYLESETDRVMSYLQELRLYFASFIANVINSFPRGDMRIRLFNSEMRYNLFYLFSTWCGMFGFMKESEQELRRNPRASALSFNALRAMSALLCGGPVFTTKVLDKESTLYRWLENMLSSGESRVQVLGRKTVQMLLQNNTHPTLFNWVIDHCYKSKADCPQLCFHALSNTLATNPSYPCDMVTVLHLVLYKTADLDFTTRERATHLLQILDKRFFGSAEQAAVLVGVPGRRLELKGCLVAGPHSFSHVGLSKELATANPELTLPMFCEMVLRFEMAPRNGQRSILQYMVPWLSNIELVDECHPPPSGPTHPPPDYPLEEDEDDEGNIGLRGSGWGSLEGTKVVLHNLLYITAKYGDEHLKEIEDLWSALCTWPQNIRSTLNFLARLTCVSGNLSVMLQQAKRIMVCFSRTKPASIVSELMRDLRSVEMISSDIQVTDSPPYYHVTAHHHAHHHAHHSRYNGGTGVAVSGEPPGGQEGAGWAMAWRRAIQHNPGHPVPLPLPSVKLYYANMKDVLRAPIKQPSALHRCNFALILLSELVITLQDVDWSPHLPLLLHVVLLGLDLIRTLIFEHSKRLLGNLVVVLACKDDKVAALQARFTQQDITLRSPSTISLLSSEIDNSSSSTTKLISTGSIESLRDNTELFQSSLSPEAKALIHFVSSRETHRAPWPFADVTGVTHQANSNGKVTELSSLVNKMLQVFEPVCASLKENWANIALQWATSCSSHQYASQSFQVCRALQLPLSTYMFREILTRLAEAASEEKEDMQSYVLEIILTLESAVDYVEDDEVQPSNVNPVTPHKYSDMRPLSSSSIITTHPPPFEQTDVPERVITPPPGPPPPAAVDSGASATVVAGNIGGSGTSIKRRHSRGRSITSRAEMMSSSRPGSAKARAEGPGPTPWSEPTQPTSPPTHETHMKEGRMMSPTHHKSPTVSGAPHLTEYESSTHSSFLSRPQSTILISHTAPMTIPEGKSAPILPHHESTKVSSSPLKSSPEQFGLEAQVVSDSVAPPSTAIAAPEAKMPGGKPTAKETSLSMMSVPTAASLASEKESRMRKGSEPPPSLQGLFDHGMGSSRRWVHKQFSADELQSNHPKQHSFDSTHLTQLRAVTPQSPKYMRRIKSPSTSDRASSNLEAAKIPRTPSHPHLNSATSTPQVSPAPNNKHMSSSESIVRAHSSQQLKMESDNEEESVILRSGSGGRSDLSQRKSDHYEGLMISSGLKLEKDRELSQSKESLSSQKESILSSSFGGLKKTPSKESLKGNKDANTPVGLKEIVLTRETHTTSQSTSAIMTSFESFSKESRERSAPHKDTQTSAESSIESTQAPLINLQSSQLRPREHADLRRRNSSQHWFRRDLDAIGHGGKRMRPSSMIETSTFRHHGQSFSSVDMTPINPAAPDLVAQLFWTAASLLESDYEGEYTMALRLMSRVFDRVDLSLNDTYERLEAILNKMKWTSFSGVQNLIMKGLTLETTSEPSRELLSRITLHSTRAVFDPSQFAGLPLNIMALMPVLVHHFDQPTEFCVKVVSEIQQACTSVDLSSEESKTKMIHMSKMFQMYATKEFTNGRDIWLAGICRYLNDAYTTLATKILRLLTDMLEKGCSTYHHPVLKLLHEYMKLQDPDNIEIKKISDSVINAATRHIKGTLWKDALGLLKLAVSNSASLVQPPTRGLPVDLGLFNQTLPGPTLQFSINLQHGSPDMSLADTSSISTAWRRPQACQRRTRERLVSVLNACVPVPVLISSPSVIFTDEQALIGETGAIYSSASEEAASSIASYNPDEMPSQPESQVYITAENVGDEFNFLNDFEYIYDQDHSGSESETPGPFSRSYQALDTELEEREDDREDGSLHGSLSSSRFSLAEIGGEVEGETKEDAEGGSTLNISPEKSPDILLRPKYTKLRSPERSPILTRRSRSHERSPDRARHLRQLKHRSLEIPSISSRSPDISKRRSHYHEGSSESDERLLDQASTPIPIPSKPPTSHSPSSSETTPEKSSPQRDDSLIEGHVKTESEDSLGGSEAVTPKLEEPPTEIGKPDRSSSVTGEIEQLPPLPEETLLSPDIISPSLKVASAEKQNGIIVSGSETSKPLDNEQLLFDMLDNKEGSTGVSHDVSNEPQSQGDDNVSDTVKKPTIQEEDQHDRTEKSEGADDILAELDELDVILDAEEEEEEEGEGEEDKEIFVAKLEEPDPGGKELDSTKQDTIDGGEMEGHQEIHRPGSVSPKEVESENEPPVVVEGSPPGAEPTGDLKSRPPETTIEVTEDHKQEPSTGAGQTQVEHIESPPEGEIESAESPPVPPIVENELQVEPGVEPVPTNVGSEQPNIGHEPPESSEAECKPPDVQPGQPKIEHESLSVEPEPVGTMQESLLVEPRGDKFDNKLESNEGSVKAHEGEPEKSELAKPGEKAVNTNTEHTHSSKESEITPYHKEPPETSSKSADMEASSQVSVHESSGEVGQPIAKDQDGNTNNDGRTTEDSPKKSEGESDQVVTEDEKGKSEQSLRKEDSLQELDESPKRDWLMDRQGSAQDLNTSRFLNFAADEIEEAWNDHVVQLGRTISASTAVNTYFLFGRLFGVLRLQFSTLTREACNYLGEDYKTIASHFLVTTEFLLSQFEIPKVYIDADMMSRDGLLEQHVFRVLELNHNLVTYMERRRVVLDYLSQFKQALRQQSMEDPSQPEGDSVSQEEAALNLCQAVHKFHFQLLLLLSSFLKLIDILTPQMEKNEVTDICRELSEIKQDCDEAVLSISRGPSPPPGDYSEKEVEQMVGVSDAVRSLEDSLAQRQCLRAVQLLHTMRKQWKREEVFGTGEDDDVDCLFFIYARYISDRQEGILYVTNTENKLSEVHARLMAQNISLHSLLEEAERLHKQNTITRDKNSLPSSSGEPANESDNRTGVEKLRIETTV